MLRDRLQRAASGSILETQPGYRTAISMIPAKEIGVAVAMGSQELPAKFTRPILALAQKVPPKTRERPAAKSPVLSDYAGRYSSQPWSSESIVLPWGNELVGLTVPSDNPVEDMVTWRHVEGDRFRSVRDDKTLGESLTFTRDSSGKVTGYRLWAGGARR